MTKNMESALVRHCAPVLLEKKPSALFVMPRWWDWAAAEQLSLGDLRFFQLPRQAKGPLIFAYRERLLERALSEPSVEAMFLRLGYPSANPDAMLLELKRRVLLSEEFPHEIGFFLGYPPEDVIGFIRHKGRDCKLCGAWKVYHDAETASRLFAEYARCKRVLDSYIQNGGTLFDGELPALLAG